MSEPHYPPPTIQTYRDLTGEEVFCPERQQLHAQIMHDFFAQAEALRIEAAKRQLAEAAKEQRRQQRKLKEIRSQQTQADRDLAAEFGITLPESTEPAKEQIQSAAPIQGSGLPIISNNFCLHPIYGIADISEAVVCRLKRISICYIDIWLVII